MDGSRLHVLREIRKAQDLLARGCVVPESRSSKKELGRANESRVLGYAVSGILSQNEKSRSPCGFVAKV